MGIEHTTPSRIFFVNKGGAGLDPTTVCHHGSPSITLHLFTEEDGTQEDIGILLPYCHAPSLFGAVLAYIEVALGPEKSAQFVTDILARKTEVLPQLLEHIEEQKAAGPCCEAGFLTGGREHTCRSGTRPRT